MRTWDIWVCGILYIATHIVLGKVFDGHYRLDGVVFMAGLTYFWYRERRNAHHKLYIYKEDTSK